LICAAYPPFGKGGGPVASQALARGLAVAGADVRVVSVGDKEMQWSEYGLDVQILPSLNIYSNYCIPRPLWKKVIWHIVENFNPRAYFAMAREMDRFKPDVVLTVSIENTNVATWLAASRRKIPVAHMLQSYFAMCWRGSMYRSSRNCIKPCLDCQVMSFGRKQSSGKVDLLCAEAQGTIDIHKRNGYFPTAQTFALPGAFVTSPPKAHRDDYTGPLRIGYLGVLTPNKGIHVLASAAALMVQRNVRLVVAGTGDQSYIDELKTAFQGIDVDFAGWVESENFLSRIDVLVVPSLWREPFGRVCVEAYLAGVPVVASRIGGLAEIVVHGVSGFQFEPGNAQELAGILDKLANDPELRASLSQGASAQAPRYEMASVGGKMYTRLKQLIYS